MPNGVPESDVRAHLETLLSSRVFARSERLSRLLRYLVEKTLEGRADELKEYVLGVEVFDKGPSFDPSTDTIVRVQARRLRQRLEEYYAGEGRREPVRINLSPGSYVPSFLSTGGKPGRAGGSPGRRLAKTGVLLAGGALTVALGLSLGLGRKASSHGNWVANPEARELYARGCYYRGLNTPDATRKSIALFEQAVARDPDYAAAHAALAGALASLGFHQLLAHSEAVPRAEEAARKALELDGRLAEPYAALGWVRFYHHRDCAGAERLLRRALALEPASARARQRLAFVLAASGRTEEAIAESRKAAEIAPSYVATNDLGMILYYARRFDEAARRADQVLDMAPDHVAAYVLRGACLVATGRAPEALQEFRKLTGTVAAVSVVPGRLGHAYAVTGRRREALAVLEELRRHAEAPGDSYTQMAFVYAGLGQPREALACLRRAIARREGESNFLAVEPIFDALRSEAAFAPLLKPFPSSR